MGQAMFLGKTAVTAEASKAVHTHANATASGRMTTASRKLVTSTGRKQLSCIQAVADLVQQYSSKTEIGFLTVRATARPQLERREENNPRAWNPWWTMPASPRLF